eukprot:3228554-Alexandrium_andersonii.AAC.1
MKRPISGDRAAEPRASAASASMGDATLAPRRCTGETRARVCAGRPAACDQACWSGKQPTYAHQSARKVRWSQVGMARTGSASHAEHPVSPRMATQPE